jgi:hypothetical protein
VSLEFKVGSLEFIEFSVAQNEPPRTKNFVLVKGVTGFYRRLWNHLCFSHDVCIGRYHQNRQNLSANNTLLTRFKAFASKTSSLALAA